MVISRDKLGSTLYNKPKHFLMQLLNILYEVSKSAIPSFNERMHRWVVIEQV